MLARTLVAAVALTLSLSVPIAATADAAPAKKCKAGQVRKGKKCVKRKPKPAAPVTPSAPATPPTAPTAPAPPPPALPAQPQVQLTPDDAAANQALANGLWLERADFASSGMFATYYRLFFYAGGRFKAVKVEWNTVSGEICDTVQTGTWSLLKGYRFDVGGGGVVAQVQITTPSANGPEILVGYARDPNHVGVGNNEVQYDVNPHMLDGC
jgi:hypothetical protein